MFTGIIESIGKLVRIQSAFDCLHFTFNTEMDLSDVLIGESIAINGVCLTVTDIAPATFKVTVVPQTLRVTNLGSLQLGSLVNLERALKTSSRLGGHYVQGHIDEVGQILILEADGGAALHVKIGISPTLAKYIVNRGYIALDGMSITVIETGADWFTVTFIPHTQSVTIVNHYRAGTKLNIEVDILSKYAEKILRSA